MGDENITIRRALTQLNMNIHNESNMSIDNLNDTINSLPDISSNLHEQIRDWSAKLENLQIQLNTAHTEVEQLSLENTELKRTNQDLLRKNELYRKINNSPLKSPTGFKKGTKIQSPKQIHKQQKSTQTTDKTTNIRKEHKQTQTDIDTCAMVKTLEKGIHIETQTNIDDGETIEKLHKTTQTTKQIEECKATVEIKHTGTQTNKDIVIHDTLHKETQTATNLDILTEATHTKETADIKSRVSKYSQREKLKLDLPKLCILSTNTQNKVLTIAQDSLHTSGLCHYIKPNCKITELLTDIDKKICDFTRNDFCIILIGDEDFQMTQDYFEIIKSIRELLQSVKHTNIIICLPTYKYGIAMDVFNWRVENFNNLLYMDVSTHEHAYIFDSNKDLSYDSTMFRRKSGHINNHGIRVMFKTLAEYLDVLREGLGLPKHTRETERDSAANTPSNHQNQFFRHQKE